GRKSLRTREQLSVEPGVALADERQSQVSKGREIATGTNRSTARHIRKDAPRQTLDEQLDRLDPRPRSPLRKRVRAEQHGGPDDLAWIWIADPAGVAAQKTKLELLGQLLGDRLRDESAEARVDAVRVLARPISCALDEPAGGTHLRARFVGEGRAGSFDSDRPHVLDPEIVSGQADRSRLS